jgi:hypothetical protein
MFSPFDLPSGILLLVTDQLSSPADFVLHRGLIDHLKGGKSENTKKAIVLSVSQDLARWTAIAAKSVRVSGSAHTYPQFYAFRICISTKNRPMQSFSSMFLSASILQIATLRHPFYAPS